MATRKTTRVDDGAVDREHMRELGRRGAAAVERDPVTKRFRKRTIAPESPPDPTPAPSPESPPAPTIAEAPGLLRRFLRRDGR